MTIFDDTKLYKTFLCYALRYRVWYRVCNTVCCLVLCTRVQGVVVSEYVSVGYMEGIWWMYSMRYMVCVCMFL